MIYHHPNNIVLFSNATSADMFTVYFIAAINGPANEINYQQFPSGIIDSTALSITYTGPQLEEEATQRDGLIMITLQRQTIPFAGSTANVTVKVLGELHYNCMLPPEWTRNESITIDYLYTSSC